jgi:hypothetical protein
VHNGHNRLTFTTPKECLWNKSEFRIAPLGSGRHIAETLPLNGNWPLGSERSQVRSEPRQKQGSVDLKKVSSFPALAVDTETKIHILGPSRAGNCFPARFLIGSPLRFPSGFFDQWLNCNLFAAD